MLFVDLSEFVGLSGIPLIAALVQMVKGMFPSLPAGWWPAVALLLGMSWNVALALAQGQDLRVAAMIGFVTGLSASGLYTWLRVRPATTG